MPNAEPMTILVCRQRLFSLALPMLVSFAGLAACNQLSTGGNQATGSDSALEIWWSEGYYPEETEAIRQAVDEWSAANNVEANLVFYSEKDLIQQSQSAIEAGDPPDVLYGYSTSFDLIPLLAWQGELADVTDVIEPIQDLYTPEALESVNYQNNQAGNRSFYAVPLSQQTTHIHYWKPLLAEAGLEDSPIPVAWDNFWQFWTQPQEQIRQKTQNDAVYSIGLPMSVAATDTTHLFEQFLEAYDVELLDSNGQPRLDDPGVREGIIRALADYTGFYRSGYVPENAIDWGDPDNNVTFLSRLTLMTANATMSIPGSQRQDQLTYKEQMATVPWPNKPSGEPMRYVTSTKQVVVLAGSNQPEQAKDLIRYLTQPDILAGYIEGAQGRFFPVMPDLLERPFWTDSSDPHVSAATQQFELTRPLYTVLNPAYSQVQAENIWGQAIHDIVTQNIPPEEAADTAIAEIKRIFAEWKN